MYVCLTPGAARETRLEQQRAIAERRQQAVAAELERLRSVVAMEKEDGRLQANLERTRHSALLQTRKVDESLLRQAETKELVDDMVSLSLCACEIRENGPLGRVSLPSSIPPGTPVPLSSHVPGVPPPVWRMLMGRFLSLMPADLERVEREMAEEQAQMERDAQAALESPDEVEPCQAHAMDIADLVKYEAMEPLLSGGAPAPGSQARGPATSAPISLSMSLPTIPTGGMGRPSPAMGGMGVGEARPETPAVQDDAWTGLVKRWMDVAHPAPVPLLVKRERNSSSAGFMTEREMEGEGDDKELGSGVVISVTGPPMSGVTSACMELAKNTGAGVVSLSSIITLVELISVTDSADTLSAYASGQTVPTDAEGNAIPLPPMYFRDPRETVGEGEEGEGEGEQEREIDTVYNAVSSAKLKAGGAVPPHILAQVAMVCVRGVLVRLAMPGVILDGYPRSLPEAVELEKMMDGNVEPEKEEKGKKGKGGSTARSTSHATNLAPSPSLQSALHSLIVLELDQGTIADRASGRLLDPEFNVEYHAANTPPPGDDPDLLARLVSIPLPQGLAAKCDAATQALAGLVSTYSALVDANTRSPMLTVSGEGEREEVAGRVLSAVRDTLDTIPTGTSPINPPSVASPLAEGPASVIAQPSMPAPSASRGASRGMSRGASRPATGASVSGLPPVSEAPAYVPPEPPAACIDPFTFTGIVETPAPVDTDATEGDSVAGDAVPVDVGVPTLKEQQEGEEKHMAICLSVIDLLNKANDDRREMLFPALQATRSCFSRCALHWLEARRTYMEHLQRPFPALGDLVAPMLTEYASIPNEMRGDERVKERLSERVQHLQDCMFHAVDDRLAVDEAALKDHAERMAQAVQGAPDHVAEFGSSQALLIAEAVSVMAHGEVVHFCSALESLYAYLTMCDPTLTPLDTLAEAKGTLPKGSGAELLDPLLSAVSAAKAGLPEKEPQGDATPADAVMRSNMAESERLSHMLKTVFMGQEGLPVLWTPPEPPAGEVDPKAKKGGKGPAVPKPCVVCVTLPDSVKQAIDAAYGLLITRLKYLVEEGTSSIGHIVEAGANVLARSDSLVLYCHQRRVSQAAAICTHIRQCIEAEEEDVGAIRILRDLSAPGTEAQEQEAEVEDTRPSFGRAGDIVASELSTLTAIADVVRSAPTLPPFPVSTHSVPLPTVYALVSSFEAAERAVANSARPPMPKTEEGEAEGEEERLGSLDMPPGCVSSAVFASTLVHHIPTVPSLSDSATLPVDEWQTIADKAIAAEVPVEVVLSREEKELVAEREREREANTKGKKPPKGAEVESTGPDTDKVHVVDWRRFLVGQALPYPLSIRELGLFVESAMEIGSEPITEDLFVQRFTGPYALPETEGEGEGESERQGLGSEEEVVLANLALRKLLFRLYGSNADAVSQSRSLLLSLCCSPDPTEAIAKAEIVGASWPDWPLSRAEEAAPEDSTPQDKKGGKGGAAPAKGKAKGDTTLPCQTPERLALAQECLNMLAAPLNGLNKAQTARTFVCHPLATLVRQHQADAMEREREGDAEEEAEVAPSPPKAGSRSGRRSASRGKK
ncbi:hypothetical protein KIPB_002105 [Kipferlia bialata]|uniref:Uncharacterized protein n=1 Tax=Kipferlia bialata TaxID=797122 RepID=A0A9K3CRL6_9EUKA|nr:hypothetical protein KIPB_002105 [Kipferlia bialata]|eukprot:g2105.t1